MTKFIGEKVLMRIFIGEGDKHGRRPLHEALVELFLREGLAGATVLRGVAGYGTSGTYHTDKLLELSPDLPMVVEVVEEQTRLDAVMPKIDALMSSGMITMEKATVIRYAQGGKEGEGQP